MTLFHLRGPVSPAFPGAVTPSAPSRVAEPDAPWDLPPPHGTSDPPPANGRHTAASLPFSDRLIDAVERALDVPTDPRSPQAPDAAQRTQQALHEAARALAGVDYLTQLELSAVHQGARFKAVAQGLGLGLSPGALDPATRDQIDARMGLRFAEAATHGDAPIDRRTAEQWLHHELFILTC